MAILWHVYKWFTPTYWKKSTPDKVKEQGVPQLMKSDTTKAKEQATNVADDVARFVDDSHCLSRCNVHC